MSEDLLALGTIPCQRPQIWTALNIGEPSTVRRHVASDSSASDRYRNDMERGDEQGGFRRIIYTSQAASGDFLGILKQSRANNGIDGISGLLAFDGSGFVQVLEGPPDSVAATFKRIASDPRHTGIRVVFDTIESERAFGDWTMAGLPDEQEEIVRDRLKALLRRVPAPVREAFSPGTIPYPHPPAG